MKKVVTFVAVALVAIVSSQANAQCVGCSQGATPSFGSQTVYSAPVQSYSAPMTYSAPMQSYSAPVVSTGCSGCGQASVQPMMSYSAPVVSNGCSGCGQASYQPAMPCGASVVSSGCGGCGQASYQPAVSYNTGCGGGCGQVAYQPAMSYGGVVTSGPVYGTVTSGCTNCGGSVTPVFQGGTVDGQVIESPVAETVENQAEEVTPPTPTPEADEAGDGT